ncbi:MAG: cation-translocating P-type ATPase [Burkholderiaceae bacterium]|jgi:Cu2+-exporting ATPase|nr:cation-translocating P-type ATPase [Burkholderiaceae bacterium]
MQAVSAAAHSPEQHAIATGAAERIGADAPARFALLDDPDEWAQFSRPGAASPSGDAPPDCWESNVVFEGMHCTACAGVIENALLAVPGVRLAEVSAASHRGRVVWDAGATRPSAWMNAALKAGYQPLPAHDPEASERRLAETRKMVWRLGVAGLCMMQVMMYATPTYFTEPGEIAPDLVNLLRWAAWVLSIPVIVFSCQPFFANAWRDLCQRRISMDLPVALAMLITFVVSTLGTFEPDGMFGREVYFDSLTMFVFFLLAGRWLELRLRDRTAGALEALMHRLPESVARQRADGSFERVSARRLRVGDVVQVLPGESFVADGVLLRGATHADEALLTGESAPVPRGVGDVVIAGSHNLSATVEQRVDHLGADTRYAQIVALMEAACTSKPRVAQLADRLAKPFLLAVLLIAALACLWWWPSDPERAVMIGVAILVVTCPCALSLATPAAMLASAGSMARSGVLVRRMQALEVLAQADTLVFDKTGTLTRDGLVVSSVQTRPGVSAQEALALAGALAQTSLHPVSRALAQAAQQQPSGHGGEGGAPCWRVRDSQELPGQGVRALLQPDSDGMAAARALRLGSAAFCGVERAGTTAVGAQAHLADDQGWLASFFLQEDLRADALAAVRALQAQGLDVRLLSGDGPQAAQSLGAQAGIVNVQGGCTPADKLAAMQALQRQGKVVAMVGDGLNDGPVLAGANVSTAFGRSVPLARAQSDFVVLGEHLMAVAQLVAKARRTMRVVRQNLAWAAAYNAVAIPLAIAGWMPPWAAGLGMASSSLLVVVNAMRLSSTDEGT